MTTETDQLFQAWLKIKLYGMFYGPVFFVLLMTVLVTLAVRDVMGGAPAFLTFVGGLILSGLVFVAMRNLLGLVI